MRDSEGTPGRPKKDELLYTRVVSSLKWDIRQQAKFEGCSENDLVTRACEEYLVLHPREPQA